MATGFYRFSADDLTEIEASFTPLPPTTLVRSVVSIDGQRFRALLADINYPEALLRVVDVNGTNLADVLVIPPLFAPRLSPPARLVAGYGSLTAADGFQPGPLAEDPPRGGLGTPHRRGGLGAGPFRANRSERGGAPTTQPARLSLGISLDALTPFYPG